MLDSWADVITSLTIAISTWWLWPQVVNREIAYVTLVIASYLLPAIVGIVKFGSFTSYHTWTVKFAAAAWHFHYLLYFWAGLPGHSESPRLSVCLPPLKKLQSHCLLRKNDLISPLFGVLCDLFNHQSPILNK